MAECWVYQRKEDLLPVQYEPCMMRQRLSRPVSMEDKQESCEMTEKRSTKDAQMIHTHTTCTQDPILVISAIDRYAAHSQQVRVDGTHPYTNMIISLT